MVIKCKIYCDPLNILSSVLSRHRCVVFVEWFISYLFELLDVVNYLKHLILSMFMKFFEMLFQQILNERAIKE